MCACALCLCCYLVWQQLILISVVLVKILPCAYSKALFLADLLDRGWRRYGSILCKPDMERTCCPSYTIRLKACDFVPSKEQVRVSRRMQR